MPREHLTIGDRLALLVTGMFATWSFLGICVAIVVVPLWIAALMPACQYASSAVIQLIALPLLAIQARISQRQGEHREAQNERRHREQMQHITATMDAGFAQMDARLSELCGWLPTHDVTAKIAKTDDFPIGTTQP